MALYSAYINYRGLQKPFGWAGLDWMDWTGARFSPNVFHSLLQYTNMHTLIVILHKQLCFIYTAYTTFIFIFTVNR